MKTASEHRLAGDTPAERCRSATSASTRFFSGRNATSEISNGDAKRSAEKTEKEQENDNAKTTAANKR
jgi:hypothetical protein